MVLTFLISYALTKIFKEAIEKQIQKKKQKNILNPRGGDSVIGLDLSDDTELAKRILSCISDNQRYIVKDPRIIKIVFNLVKARVKQESLILTPNMMRFLALKLFNSDQTLIIKFGNIISYPDNPIRLLIRLGGTFIIGITASLTLSISYGLLLMFIYYDNTENCAYSCSKYFEQLSPEGPIHIYDKKSTGHVVIGSNDDARQIAIYTPSTDATEVVISSNGSLKTTKQSYKQVRTKAKQVNFSDFRKTDPVLSSFSDLDEPQIPQKNCQINEIHEIIDIQID